MSSVQDGSQTTESLDCGSAVPIPTFPSNRAHLVGGVVPLNGAPAPTTSPSEYIFPLFTHPFPSLKIAFHTSKKKLPPIVSVLIALLVGREIATHDSPATLIFPFT